MIIDIHTHFPHDPQQWSAFNEDMKAYGVDHYVVLPLGDASHFPDEEEVSRANREGKAFAEMSEGRALWFCYLNPRLPNWREELDRGIEAGASGIKLWVSLKTDEGSTHVTLDVFREAEKRRLPVMCHTFQRGAEPNYPGEIDMRELVAMAEQVPEARIIAAHSGANWQQCLGILPRHLKNLCMDISGMAPRQGMVEALVKDLGAERVLFGSDAQGRTFPSQFSKVMCANINAHDRELVLYGNACRILGLVTSERSSQHVYEAQEAKEIPIEMDEDHFCFSGVSPFRSSPVDLSELSWHLRDNACKRGYAANLNHLYSQNLLSCNRDYFTESQVYMNIVPLASINPALLNFRECIADAKATGYTGVFFSPYLHAYKLGDARLIEAFEKCQELEMRVWLNVQFGDPRFRHTGKNIESGAANGLVDLMKRFEDLEMVIQGALPTTVKQCLDSKCVMDHKRFEISRCADMVSYLENLLLQYGPRPFVFGSEFPLRPSLANHYTLENLHRLNESVRDSQMVHAYD